MELSAVKSRRTREITGPTPHSVAVRGKPTLSRPREYLILERRKQEELREEANAMVNYNKQFDLKTSWERTTDKKIQSNTIQRRVESLLRQQQYSLEERRDRLRSLLQSEEEQYLLEISSKQETVLERQAKMRERARMLKDRRETERMALVEKKLDQRWRDQCEDLRSILSKRHQDEVCRDRAEQLRLKQEEKKREQEVEQMYAKLWDDDRQAKCKREEIEAALQIERNRDMLKMLTLQTAANEKQRDGMKRLKEQEAELLREEAALRALEEQRMKEDKRRRQEETKAVLDYSLKLKMKKKAKDVQQELALDMKLLEQMLAATSNEAMQSLQRKNQLRDEMNLYRQYLAEQAKEEEKIEKELDALITSEVAKQWDKRTQQWKREREARTKLMKDVLDTRKLQIKEKLTRIEEEKEVMEKERQEMLENLEKHKELERQQREQIRKDNITHQSHLRHQMDFQKRLKEFEGEQTRRELELQREAEELHQMRVKEALSKPHQDKIHPKRLLVAGQGLV